jgi:hypothetical protein
MREATRRKKGNFFYWRNLEIRGIIKYLKRENPQGSIKNVKKAQGAC